MPWSSKFLAESTGEKIVKTAQYLVKIWTKYDSLLFWPPCMCYFLFSNCKPERIDLRTKENENQPHS